MLYIAAMFVIPVHSAICHCRLLSVGMNAQYCSFGNTCKKKVLFEKGCVKA